MSAELPKFRLPKSLRFRMFAAFSVFIFFISATFTSIWVFKEIRTSRKDSTETARLIARKLAGDLRLPLFAGNRETVSTLVLEVAGHNGIKSVTVFDSTGALVSVSPPSPDTDGSDTLTIEETVYSGDFGPSPEQLIGGAPDVKSPIGKITLELTNKELNKRIRSLIGIAALTGFAFWVIFVFIASRIVRWGTKSITPLLAGLRSIHSGDYSTRIETGSQDELADAAAFINDLAMTLQAREAENARLQQELLDSMKSEVREERRRIMAKLIQTNRMTSLGLLVSGAAHEINTPNGAIKLAGQKFGRLWKDAEKILDRVAADEGDFSIGGIEFRHARTEVANSLELINRCSDRISQVLNELREYSVGEQSRGDTEVNINRVVNDALAVVSAHRQTENILLDRQLAENIPAITGNRYQLGQVITNLLINAMQAIPEGMRGMIIVKTGVDQETGDIVISVGDDGTGIPEEIRARLKEPFFSTRFDKGGSGLGLYISDYIIKNHNGSISFESEVGQGSLFTVLLPSRTIRPQASSAMSAG